jgi:hypothetical protein
MEAVSKSKINIDLTQNPKQAEYFYKVLQSAKGVNQYRYFAYGGAIRGGKSFVTASIYLVLCKIYPGSRWHVVRQDMPVLEATTIPTFEKLIKGSPDWKFVRNTSNYRLIHKNGSQIFFKGENLARDPDLNDFLGLETNGIWIEQAEETSEKLWEKSLERTGSWYIDPMPPGFIFLTFNPTQNWVKDKFYSPWLKGELLSPFYFESALPKDNPFVTADQWRQWDNMADRYKLQFIEGDWNDFSDKSNLWAFAYEPKKHRGEPELNPHETVYLSFDFNVNPMCCTVIQHYDRKLKVLEVIKIPNSGTHEMCDYILASRYRNSTFMVTGDASGRQRNASQADNAHNYTIIQKKLRLGMNQFRVPGSNPKIEENKVLVNSILQNYPVEIHVERAKSLHYDLGNVRTHADNTIIKTDRKAANQQADALDTFRYWCNTFMPDFLRIGG